MKDEKRGIFDIRKPSEIYPPTQRKIETIKTIVTI
jgi:hypothetical protein